MGNKTTETAPTRIWLQVDAEACAEIDGHLCGDDEPFPRGHEGVTWCDEPIGGLEVEYVRADLVRAAMPVNWMDEPETRALGEALHLTANGQGSRSEPA